MTTYRPTPTDSLWTETSTSQAETEEILAKHIPSADNPAQPLHRNAHLQWLVRNLIQGFPTRYTSQDASQPWLMFWTLQSLSTLQAGLDAGNKQKAINTIMSWQHPEGGFGGGPGQAPHLLATYASVCALANVGRPGPGGGWDQIDREKMYKFFMSVKQPDGSFTVMHHGEVDVRGIYCMLVVATLLDLLTPELVEGTAAFLASCQTYEGGFSSASQPYFSSSSLLPSPRPPLGEAHGGYTFCALASWVMVRSFAPPPEGVSIDVRRLLRWLVMMQGSEQELGGFRGRTNKLVDGCYSWWVGGAFALLEMLGVPGHHAQEDDVSEGQEGAHDEWDDVDDALFNRKALQEYILYAGQHPTGGLRDKPPKVSDAYHTLSCLSGLASAQHHVTPSSTRREEITLLWETDTDSPFDEQRKSAFADALAWVEEEGASKFVGGSGNRVNATHPIFNLTMTHTDAMMGHFYRQTVPPRMVRRRP
ncbi:terpenoid cyclases/Protein prenyltransferase [Gloeophyllum trabeum ATCC 11539]|uniref:Protein farnesyltransferase subunit beta n=1 Tax=Gloeophyllum trabeum (strain ATCC 11539 / FP-39264 / Madison 617) TaxID=670483 RepID=S7Q2L5_GLOTA|nr:terpenoid cyclases/Protein prenyltransferase [Gloeophyllum trabeum ATCC 11539]EPQ53792.1 terpenoid cyclases/Protein prenyltransferase [Gloeophyllum trabeum ATCC 11539]